MIKYKFYATLLDSFQNYLDSSEIYQQYWGNSENPEKNEQEFEQEQFQSLIDRINRVPFESEAADKGTAFNEVVDCLIEGRTSEIMNLTSNPETGTITVKWKNWTFTFPTAICLEFKNYYKQAIPQVRTEATISTKYGEIEIYGNIDELLPDKVCDIKTTGKYNAFKFRKHWQHLVYPYCLTITGNYINVFEYNVTDFKDTWTETYTFDEYRDIPKLINHCEALVEFIEANKHLITDKKIFNEQ